MHPILNHWRNLKPLPIAILGFVLLINACAQTNVIEADKPEYSIGFVNRTGHDLDRVSAYANNKVWARPKMLVAGGEATQSFIVLPIPPEAEVQVVENGEHRTIKVSLENVPKNGFHDGTIFFVINTNGTVDVEPIKDGDTSSTVKLVMSARPKGQYRIGFINKTGHDLQTISVYYGVQQVCSVEDVLARVKVGYSDPLTLPIPSEAEVRWKEDGVDHSVKLKFEGIVPEGYAAGTIFFVIKGGDNVDVKPIKWGDSQASINLVK